MPRLLLIVPLVAIVGLATGPGAVACGSEGYTYAGLSSRTAVYGVGAQLTSLASPTVENGHVAGFVGVGGPGLGPHGSSEWIQVGYSGFHSVALGSLYYEVAQPGNAPSYHEISASIPAGERHRVAVLEVASRADWWRVWVDGHPVSRSYHLPGSHGAWHGIATAENWGGGVPACNSYSYRFDRVVLARAPGGDWSRVDAFDAIRQGENRFLPVSTSSFIARTRTRPTAPGATATAQAGTASSDDDRGPRGPGFTP